MTIDDELKRLAARERSFHRFPFSLDALHELVAQYRVVQNLENTQAASHDTPQSPEIPRATSEIDHRPKRRYRGGRVEGY